MTPDSFEQTIIDRTPFLHTVALKLTRNSSEAEDLVQETLLMALRNRDKFAEGTRMEAWLYTILRNGYINRYRKQKKWKEAARHLFFRQRSLPQHRSNEGLTRMLLKTVRQKLEELPVSYSRPLKLALSGYRYHEIAEMTGHPLGTVKSQIHMGRNLLKTALKNVTD